MIRILEASVSVRRNVSCFRVLLGGGLVSVSCRRRGWACGVHLGTGECFGTTMLTTMKVVWCEAVRVLWFSCNSIADRKNDKKWCTCKLRKMYKTQSNDRWQNYTNRRTLLRRVMIFYKTKQIQRRVFCWGFQFFFMHFKTDQNGCEWVSASA